MLLNSLWLMFFELFHDFSHIFAHWWRIIRYHDWFMPLFPYFWRIIRIPFKARKMENDQLGCVRLIHAEKIRFVTRYQQQFRWWCESQQGICIGPPGNKIVRQFIIVLRHWSLPSHFNRNPVYFFYIWCDAFPHMISECQFTHWICYMTSTMYSVCTPLQWRHNERDGLSNHQPHGCLLSRLCRRRSKKTSKPRVTGLCEGNSPVTGEFPAQKSSNAENVSIWLSHHA